MLRTILTIILTFNILLFLSSTYADLQTEIVNAYTKNKAQPGGITPQTRGERAICMISWGIIGELALDDPEFWSGVHSDFNYKNSNWLYEHWLHEAIQVYGSDRASRFAKDQKKFYDSYWKALDSEDGDMKPLFKTAGNCYVAENERVLSALKIGIKNAVNRYESVALPEKFLKGFMTDKAIANTKQTAPNKTAKAQKLSYSATSSLQSSSFSADNQAKLAAERGARRLCKDKGGKPIRVYSVPTGNERVTDTKYRASVTATVQCQF